MDDDFHATRISPVSAELSAGVEPIQVGDSRSAHDRAEAFECGVGSMVVVAV